MNDLKNNENLEVFQEKDEAKECTSLTEMLSKGTTTKSMENQTYNSLSSIFSPRRSF